MSLLVALDSKVCTVGMRVQDSWGACGTVAWVGKLDKNPPPPNNGPTKATYAGVLFDIPIAATSKWRCDGTLHGVTLVPNALPGQVGYIQPKFLFKEVIPTGLAALRKHYGPRIAHLEDEFLEKFLIARRFELPAVIKMLDDHLKWLDEYKPRLDEYFPPEMAKGYPTGCQAPPATDYEGNLIRILRPGNLGAVMPKDFVSKWTIPLIMRWHATDMLQWTQDLRNTQWRSRRYCVIIDLKDLGDCDSSVLSFAKGLNAMDQANFPENVYRMCIVNAPSFFAMVWRLVRALVDDRTKEKIQIFSTSDTKKGALLEFLAAENLPTALGGTNDSFLRNGGVVGSLNPAQAVDMAKLALAGPMPDVNDPDVQAAMAAGSEASPITAKSPAVGTPASP